MSNIDVPEFAIIVDDEHQFTIWPTNLKLLPGWRYSGPVGTRSQMQDLLGKQFLTTLAATYLRPETRFGDSRL